MHVCGKNNDKYFKKLIYNDNVDVFACNNNNENILFICCKNEKIEFIEYIFEYLESKMEIYDCLKYIEKLLIMTNINGASCIDIIKKKKNRDILEYFDYIIKICNDSKSFAKFLKSHEFKKNNNKILVTENNTNENDNCDDTFENFIFNNIELI